MIWLVSFPRSGNTFARNVLYQSYGLVSTEVNLESLQYSSTHEEFPVVKTHLRPGQVPLRSAEHVVVYLVRDGRDAVVSIAHHRTNIVAPGSDFTANLEEAIRAEEGSYFGGWGLNVAEWMAHADIVIYFEDLISDPIGQLERIRHFVRLPEAVKSELPTFSSQKFGNPKYGPQKGENKLFFRKGKSNGWKDEMPVHLETLFWKKNGLVMQALGYQRTGERMPLPDSAILRAQSGKLVRHQSGIGAMIKQSIQDWILNTKVHSSPQWKIQPEVIVLDTGIDLDHRFSQVLSSQYSFHEIGLFTFSDGSWTDLGGDRLSQPERCNVVITDCSRPDFLSRVQLNNSPKWIAWICEPVTFIAETWERSQNRSGSIPMTQDSELSEAIRTEIELFVQTYNHRNRMYRVISTQSTFLDVVGDLGCFEKDLPRIADILAWTNLPTIDQEENRQNLLVKKEWFCELVRMYNKKDVELYEVWTASRNVSV